MKTFNQKRTDLVEVCRALHWTPREREILEMGFDAAAKAFKTDITLMRDNLNKLDKLASKLDIENAQLRQVIRKMV